MTQKNLKSVVAAVVGLASQGFAESPLDAQLETSSGHQTTLARKWGRPTVLFYEDRDSTGLNKHVKDELFKRGRELGMLERVSVIAVANVAAYDWFPARNFVLAAVKDIEHELHVPVLLDFKGTMTGVPWHLPSKSSTVVVLDGAGAEQARWSGHLTPTDLEALLAQLAALTRGARTTETAL